MTAREIIEDFCDLHNFTFKFGGEYWDRTSDTRINSPPLYL